MEKTKEDILLHLQKIAEESSHSDFHALYIHYYKRLLRQALYYFPHAETAREIVADVFVSLWERRKVLNKVSDPDAYLFISTKYACTQYLKRNNPVYTSVSIDEFYDLKEDHLSDRLLIDEELQGKYKEAFQKLPPRCAEVFRLIREEKKKYSEAAELLGISVKTVDNQLNKAVKILYSELKEYLFFLFF